MTSGSQMVKWASLKGNFLRSHRPIRMASERPFRDSTITWGRQKFPRDRTMLLKNSKSESRLPGHDSQVARTLSSPCKSRIVRKASELSRNFSSFRKEIRPGDESPWWYGIGGG